MVEAPPLVKNLVGRTPSAHAPSAQFAKLCIPFVVAVALIRGTVFVDDFWEEGLRDPVVHELAGRIKVVQDPEIQDENIMVPLRVHVQLKDGSSHELTLDQVIGHPDKPLTQEQHLGKFHACWEAGAGHLPKVNRDRLADLVDGLEDTPSVEEIVRLLVP